VLYSTLTQPEDFERQGMSWWVRGPPAAGNISIFSKEGAGAGLGPPTATARSPSIPAPTSHSGRCQSPWGLTAAAELIKMEGSSMNAKRRNHERETLLPRSTATAVTGELRVRSGHRRRHRAVDAAPGA